MSAAPRPDGSKASRGRASATSRHSAARLAALQALYQVEMTGAPGAQVIDEFIHHRLGRPDAESGTARKTNEKRFTELVRGVTGRGGELDALIGPLLASGWRLERLEIVMRCLLRLGAWELLALLEVPARVVISEYVALAGAFYSGDEPGAVNGILDRLARKLRPGELEAKPDGPRRSQRPPE
jgi:N utilization substance protein B